MSFRVRVPAFSGWHFGAEGKTELRDGYRGSDGYFGGTTCQGQQKDQMGEEKKRKNQRCFLRMGEELFE